MKMAFIAALAASILMSGCVTRGVEMTGDGVATIVQGKTTKAQMLERFGPPIGQGYTDNGLLLMNWMFMSVGFGGLNTRTQMLSTVFDEQDRVKRYTFTDTDPPTGQRPGE